MTQAFVAPSAETDSTDPAPVLSSASRPRTLTEAVVEAIRVRHLARKTEQAYVHWIRRFVAWSGRRHPRDMGAAEVEAFLTFLATERNISDSTQRQALSAILFLYRQVLAVELPWLDNIVRAKPSQHLPVVLSRAEVQALCAQLRGERGLVLKLMYGSGLRLNEALRLRVKDLDLERLQLTVRDGKGGKDRTTTLPASLVPALRWSRRRSAVYTRIYTGLAALLLAALAACGGGGDDCDEERPKVRAEQPTEEPPCKGIPVDQLPAACGFPADGEQPTPPADCLGRREGCV